MSTQDDRERVVLLQGTLDLLVLRILTFGHEHGQGIARAIQRQTDGTLLVDHGSLYPALQRLERREWIEAEWGTSELGRRAKFYRITGEGRRRLQAETQQWARFATGVSKMLLAGK